MRYINNIINYQVLGLLGEVGTYAGQPEVDERSYPSEGVEEKVGRFDVAVYDTTRVYVPQSTKHAPEVRSDPSHR